MELHIIHYTQEEEGKKEEEKEEDTEVGYNSEVLPRRSGSRGVPRSAATAQTTSAVATAIAIEEETRAAKKPKRSPEVYLPLPHVSVNLRLKLCLSLGDVRLFIHTLPAQNQWTRGHVSPAQDR